MEEDTELRALEQKKMAQLKRRLATPTQPSAPKEEKSPRALVEEALVDRGDEVLDAAYSFFPAQTERIVQELARMIKAGRLQEKISGGELLATFRQLGLRFSLKTSIKVQDRGKFVELSDKLKQRNEE